jgi:ATP-binding cassette subfamily F protein uup
VRHADGLATALLDQYRTQFDPAVTLARALAPEGDQVVYRGRPVHVAGWARRFLFRPEQLQMPVGRLSGGEQARVHLARLMLVPADLLVLDEPTNDLDIPTLEVLEETLLEFPGAVVLVTHDRYLFERVSTTVLALDGHGRGDAVRRLRASGRRRGGTRVRPEPKAAPRPVPARPAVKRLSYLEQREWEGWRRRSSRPRRRATRARPPRTIPPWRPKPPRSPERYRALEDASAAVDRLYARWAELDAKRGA